jgi:hypothetical protein
MVGYLIKNGLNSSEEVFLDKEAAYSYCGELVNNGKTDAYVKEVQIVDEKRRNVTIAEDITKTLNFIEQMNLNWDSYVYSHAINGRPCVSIDLHDDDDTEVYSWAYYLDTLTKID